MPFFKYFPDIYYRVDPEMERKILKDLTVSFKFFDVFDNGFDQMYVDYLVKDGEKAEHIAYRVYGDSELHWIVLMFNKIKDPYFEWPLTNQEFQAFVQKKYQGVSLFMDPETTFLKSNLTSPVLEARLSIEVGLEVTQGSTKGTIVEWDSTLRCIRVGNISGGVFAKSGEKIKITNGNESYYATISRVVEDSTVAAHHFEDLEGNTVNPYNIVSNKLQPDSYIVRYTNNSYDGLEVITNREYEDRKNEAKRLIKIPRKEIIPQIVDSFSKLFK